MRIHNMAIWNEVLDVTELVEIFTHGSSIDLRESVGSYTSPSNLQHYWKLGADSDDIGQDYGNGTAIDVDANASNIAKEDVVGDAP
jgi:hypothetical protein